MLRSLSPWVVVVALAAVATAAPPTSTPTTPPGPSTGPAGGFRAVMDTPSTAFTPDPMVSPRLFLNRCVGDCSVTGSTMNDARVNQSTVPCAGGASCSNGGCTCSSGSSGTYTIGEFTNVYGDKGANGTCTGDGTTKCTMDADCTTAGGTCDTADLEWSQLVQCVKEVYSPFAITVTDQEPTGGVSFSEDIVAGQPSDIGFGGVGILGISPYPHIGDCTAHDNVISFSFANAHPAADRILNLCWTVSQESAHAFGLDHEYSFTDSTAFGSDSACNDPMTYRNDCGGEKFFRNVTANCGEYATRTCACGGAQNSYQKLLNVFGAGTSLIPAPTATIETPAAGPVQNKFVVHASAGSKRGVTRVELWLNGFKWASVGGAMFGQNGQLDPSEYTLTAPGDVPDGVIDIVVKAFDDLGAEGDSATVTVTKGQPCTDASMCAKGQKCDSGKCYWDPASGQLGDPCTYPQFCQSGICMGTADEQVCTQDCIFGADGSCPNGLDCVQTSGTNGICFPPEKSGGCCSVGHEAGAPWAEAGLGLMVLGLVMRRRRR